MIRQAPGGNGDLRRFRLGEFVVDANARTLSHAGKTIALAPRTMDVLTHLARNAGETVTNDALLAAYWRGPFSSTNAIHKCVAELRQALGDYRADPQYIVTVPRRGYRLVAAVESTQVAEAGTTDRQTDTEANSKPAASVATPVHLPSTLRIMVATLLPLLFGAIVWNAIDPDAVNAPTGATAGDANAATESGTEPNAQGASTATAQRIAVLGITSNDTKDAELARAVRAALLTRIGSIERLTLLSSEQLIEMPSETQQARSIAAATNAAYLVAGSVVRHTSGAQLRLTLFRGNDGARLYAYDHVMQGDTAAAAVEAGEAMRAAAEVLTHPDGIKKMAEWGTRSPEAFLSMQDALSARMLRDQASTRRALAGYRDAIALDPTFVLAYVQFAADAATLARFTDDREAISDILQEVHEMRRLMMKHRPKARDIQYFDDAEAMLRGDAYATREATVRARIAALKPGEPCNCYAEYVNFLMAGRLYDEAEAYRLRYLRDAPGDQFYTLMARGSIVRLKDGPFMARDIMKRTLAVFPNDIAMLNGMVIVLAQTGEFEEAQEYLKQLESVDRDGLWAYSAKLVMLALRGDLKPRSTALKAALADARALPLTDGIVLFTLGDVPGGVDAWSTLTPESFDTLASYAAFIETTFPGSVLKDARYQALMERLGIGASWTAQLRRNVAMLAPITGVPAGPVNTGIAVPRLATLPAPPAN